MNSMIHPKSTASRQFPVTTDRLDVMRKTRKTSQEAIQELEFEDDDWAVVDFFCIGETVFTVEERPRVRQIVVFR